MKHHHAITRFRHQPNPIRSQAVLPQGRPLELDKGSPRYRTAKLRRGHKHSGLNTMLISTDHDGVMSVRRRGAEL